MPQSVLSEAMFYENYLTSDFHTNTVISRCVCLWLVKMALKTARRPISSCRTCLRGKLKAKVESKESGDDTISNLPVFHERFITRQI